MALIVKRTLDSTWREAVGARAAEAGREGAALDAYDLAVAAGAGEAAAAFRALAGLSLLWQVPMPDDPVPAPTADPHEVPPV